MNRIFFLFKKLILSLIIQFCGVQGALSVELPQWEWGISYIDGTTPHYFGSNQYFQANLFFPYFNYRTARYQIGDDNRLYLWQSKNQSLSFNLNGRLPVESSELKKVDTDFDNQKEERTVTNVNVTRRGMPDLPLVLFTGVKYQSYFNQHFFLDLSLMTGTPLGVPYEPVGNYLSPSFNLDFFKKEDLSSLIFFVSWLVGDHVYNRFYYDVPEENVLSGRPFYKAEAGLVTTNIGWELSFDITDRLKVLVGYYGHYMEDSIVRESPLVVSENSQSLIIFLIYKFGVSKKKVTLPK